MNRFAVRHWVACLEARFGWRDEWVHCYDLLGVSYTHTVPADTEFPCELSRLDLFARFFNGRGTREFEVAIIWADGPRGPELIETYGPFTVHFPFGQPARNYVFRLRNIALLGPGRYQARLKMIRPRRRRQLAVEFFEVTIQP